MPAVSEKLVRAEWLIPGITSTVHLKAHWAFLPLELAARRKELDDELDSGRLGEIEMGLAVDEVTGRYGLAAEDVAAWSSEFWSVAGEVDDERFFQRAETMPPVPTITSGAIQRAVADAVAEPPGRSRDVLIFAVGSLAYWWSVFADRTRS